MSENAGSIIDFSDRAQKARVMGTIGALSGPYVLSCRRYRPRRSLKANAFWWGVVIPAFQQFMRGQNQFFDKDEIHEFFLQKFASRDVIDPATGEVMAVVGHRSSKMDTEQFSTLMNEVIEWMADRFNIVIPDPSIYEPQRRAAGAEKASHA